jgi:hypothetical protein
MNILNFQLCKIKGNTSKKGTFQNVGLSGIFFS